MVMDSGDLLVECHLTPAGDDECVIVTRLCKQKRAIQQAAVMGRAGKTAPGVDCN